MRKCAALARQLPTWAGSGATEHQTTSSPVRRATETASDLGSQLSDTHSRLKASEIARVNAQDQLDRVMREAADARAENRSLRSENDKLRGQVDRLNQDLTEARGRISDLQSQNSSYTTKLNETSSRVESMERAEREKQQAEARRRDFAALQAGVAGLATVKPSGNGFIATLSDTFFVPNQTALQLR